MVNFQTDKERTVCWEKQLYGKADMEKIKTFKKHFVLGFTDYHYNEKETDFAMKE